MSIMRHVTWRGPPPAPAVRTRLADAGFALLAGGDNPEALVVVASASARSVPDAPAAASWIWWCAREIPQAAAAEAIRRGAYDALSGARDEDAGKLVQRLVELGANELGPPATPGLIAESPAARRVLDQAWRAARTLMPVLLTGETGTGKEVTASLIHRWSGRAGPYVPINCAAVPNELMESELFGHMRGAFSGAVATVDGKLLAAQGGSVFLDEIDDTPLSIQNKLLRVLEDGEVTRVGENQSHRADFRLIAATNRDLQPLIAAGRFGRDFFERLAIVRIELPRLGERRADIPAFVQHFIRRFYEQQDLPPKVEGVAPRALVALTEHSWPGNIRELRNAIYQALVYKRGGNELLLADLRGFLERRHDDVKAGGGTPALIDPELLRGRIEAGNFSLRGEVAELELQALRIAWAKSGGRPTAAARLLGEVGRGRSSDPGGTVRAMVKRLGL
jgi:DNA-binding NtrC family response regulator